MRPERHNFRARGGTNERRAESGQVTAFVVVMATALILCAGLVIDGGLTLAAKIRATDEAQSASRAGAEQIDLATYRSSGAIVLDSNQATIAAERYLASTGDHGQVAVDGNTVTVTVVAYSQPKSWASLDFTH